MRDLPSLRARATLLMQNAMVLLDEAGEGIAAARLQSAIDTVSLTGEWHDAEARSEEPWPSTIAARQHAALVRAIGGVLAGAAASFARRKPMSVSEFARFLATYAAVTSETSKEEEQIIASC
jgi:hypothetical protein